VTFFLSGPIFMGRLFCVCLYYNIVTIISIYTILQGRYIYARVSCIYYISIHYVGNKIMYLFVFRCRRKSVKSSEEWLSSSVKDTDKIGQIHVGLIYYIYIQ
jgi:hypothetical protein